MILEVGRYSTRKLRAEAMAEGMRREGEMVLHMPGPVEQWDQLPWTLATAAFTCGMHDQEAEARKLLAEYRIPLVVLDLGYLRRADRVMETGYHQVGIGRIGWLPPVLCPPDRWDALEIELVEARRADEGERVLVLGQVPHDSQHHLSADRLARWLRARAAVLREMLGLPVVLRPHPEVEVAPPVEEVWTIEEGVPLEDAVAISRVVVTFNSTAGVEAVRQAVPVVCDPGAHYAEVAWCQGVRDRRDYFQRLAYAQWTLEELASGAAWRFVRQFLAAKR